MLISGAAFPVNSNRVLPLVGRVNLLDNAVDAPVQTREILQKVQPSPAIVRLSSGGFGSAGSVNAREIGTAVATILAPGRFVTFI